MHPKLRSPTERRSVGRDEKKEGEERKVFPATTHASKDTPKEERRRVPCPAMTKASWDTRRRKEGEERKERKKEREEKEREGEKGRGEKGRCSQLRTIVQGHTKERKG